MRALITGAAGQVGRAVLRTAPDAVEVVAADRGTLDITDAAAIDRHLDETRPTVVINAAAYTAVDRAESEPDLAFAVNAVSVGLLAQACRQRAIKLVHVSTDFVFDGAQPRPYHPAASVNPLGVYGASKRDGERDIAATQGLTYAIVRTAWVYSATGRNFLTTMLRLFREQTTVRVVADQVGTPTSAITLAKCLWKAAADERASGTLHFTDAGVASWYDFAVAIHESARERGLAGRCADIVPITTEQYPTAARRPAYSVLDKTMTWQSLGITPLHWSSALDHVLQEIVS